MIIMQCKTLMPSYAAAQKSNQSKLTDLFADITCIYYSPGICPQFD